MRCVHSILLYYLRTARTGCHALALELVSSWSFDRPTNPLALTPSNAYIETDTVPPLPDSPTRRRKPLPGMPTLGRRRSSIIVDIDVPSDPSTRSTSPEPSKAAEVQPPGPKAEFKSLLRTAKQDVSVPEFSMDAFF